ncbi:hypothetical protein [Clostridium sp. Cult2]|uniref:hypothetical protein n=1 Tax=Clostridium sp. Cult2 TaxID=2079003 RepID=UPI001F22FA80|nr:hypothetical protein [Clostridium sp. Cult2]MCF6465537.1 hypothetical protein [Clostridium sp. Cult2]
MKKRVTNKELYYYLIDEVTETFELIINKHESYSSKEVKRILKNKGIFITQLNCIGLFYND